MRPIKRPRPAFLSQGSTPCGGPSNRACPGEGRGRVDHDRLALGRLRCRQALHHADEDAFVAPLLPAIIKRPFDKLRTGFAGPYSLGASRQLSPLRLTKMIPLKTRRSLLSDGHWAIRLDLHDGTLLGGPLLIEPRLTGLASLRPRLAALRQLASLAARGELHASPMPRERRAAQWILELRVADRCPARRRNAARDGAAPVRTRGRPRSLAARKPRLSVAHPAPGATRPPTICRSVERTMVRLDSRSSQLSNQSLTHHSIRLILRRPSSVISKPFAGRRRPRPRMMRITIFPSPTITTRPNAPGNRHASTHDRVAPRTSLPRRRNRDMWIT